jgi:long-chain acyl-CoA synthetase
LARYETPKKIGLLESPFTIEDGTLTPTQKVKRRAVESRCSEIIDLFYAPESVDQTVFVER